MQALHAKSELNYSGNRRHDVLKLIAIITMLIDHIGYIFFPQMRLFRTIGRIAFPIFAYQIAMGYKHTSSRPRYALRLFVFSLVAYLPYVFFNPNIEPNFLAFNVMFLLLAGIGAMALWDLMIGQFKYYSITRQPLHIVLGVALLAAFILYLAVPDILKIIFRNIYISQFDVVNTIRVSYGTYGLLLIMLFYWFEGNALLGITTFIVITLFSNFINGAYSVSNMYNIHDISLRFQAIGETLIKQPAAIWRMITNNGEALFSLSGYFFQARAIMGVILIYLLKERPFHLKLNKYIAYWFYPIHISLIMLIYYFFVVR